MINSNNKLDVTLDFENVDMNDVNVYVAFKNNGKLVGMKMPQASELKGIDLIDKEYTDIEVYAWDNKQKPYANIVRIINNVQINKKTDVETHQFFLLSYKISFS